MKSRAIVLSILAFVLGCSARELYAYLHKCWAAKHCSRTDDANDGEMFI